ncbi:Ubiquitin-associated protein 1 [Holotrichia oblita]|uniref:Ubiquitin-associated protein 1 n=1 Tax=Holotrichia oblita TaxID=644536 RepID=A0ACB9SZF9_HOLOL|nr:Ubiquitin-associated protein 1 [Holotrichia oblita]
MSFKQGQEQQASYMDGVKVKISERYKPPPKITLPISYSQRLSLNNHIQDNIPRYDFSFEKNAKECMRALREAKLATSNQRKERLEKIKEVREKERAEKLKQEEECKKSETNVQNKEVVYNLNNSERVNMNNISTYESSTGVLIPTQVSSAYTNILTPTLHSDINIQNSQTIDKSPFNISDFEADTSSPFDNMALKTINDMAELAIVLQNEDKNNKQTYSYAPINTGTYTQTYSNYVGNQNYNFSELPSTSTSPYIPATNCVYSASNGYYYSTMPSTYNSSYLYNDSNTVQQQYNKTYELTSPQKADDDNIQIKTVPDIMKALETELNNTHINKINQAIPNITRTKERSNSESKSDIADDVFKNLPKNLQILSKNISSMGFPLDRVSRTCKIFGDDQKKVVEHLLAMTDLLDLGFPETQVSSALVQCNNDRDKALDKLIL